MKIVEIKQRWNGSVLFSAEVDVSLPWGLRLGAAVRLAYSSGADLSGADLRDADLRGADLRGVNLRCADLRDADLRGADLRGAVLHGAGLSCADLSSANLSGAVLRGADLGGSDLSDAVLSGAVLSGVDLRGADLSCADLSGANLRDAVLRGADLRDADLRGAFGLVLPTPEEANRRIRAVAQAALATDNALHMGDWHKCETAHCIAGWAVHLEGPVGYILEKAVGSPMAGLMLLGVEAHSHFYDTNEQARAWLQSKLEPVKTP